MSKFECDNCGACCKGHLLVETEELDVLREPRLIDADPHWQGTPVEKVLYELQTEMKVVIIACGTPCSFLSDNRCSIYPTRPNCCVALQAGDEQCQEARMAAGLEPLLPVQ